MSYISTYDRIFRVVGLINQVQPKAFYIRLNKNLPTSLSCYNDFGKGVLGNVAKEQRGRSHSLSHGLVASSINIIY